MVAELNGVSPAAKLTTDKPNAVSKKIDNDRIFYFEAGK
jgi:hypothetical protein